MLVIAVLMVILLVSVYYAFRQEDIRQQKERTPTARIQPEWNEKDRREHQRVNLVFNARYQRMKDNGKHSKPSKKDEKSTLQGLTDNISLGGLKLIVYEKLKIGDQMDLEVEVSPYDLLKCKGKVVWVKELTLDGMGDEENKEKRSFAIGFQFTHLSPQCAKRLASLLDVALPDITTFAA